MNIKVAAVAQNMTGTFNNLILSHWYIPYVRSNRIPVISFWKINKY